MQNQLQPSPDWEEGLHGLSSWTGESDLPSDFQSWMDDLWDIESSLDKPSDSHYRFGYALPSPEELWSTEMSGQQPVIVPTCNFQVSQEILFQPDLNMMDLRAYSDVGSKSRVSLGQAGQSPTAAVLVPPIHRPPSSNTTRDSSLLFKLEQDLLDLDNGPTTTVEFDKFAHKTAKDSEACPSGRFVKQHTRETEPGLVPVPSLYPCTKCKIKYDRKCDLTKHEKRTHVLYSARPFRCKVCGYRFLYPKDLRRHSGVHTRTSAKRRWRGDENILASSLASNEVTSKTLVESHPDERRDSSTTDKVSSNTAYLHASKQHRHLPHFRMGFQVSAQSNKPTEKRPPIHDLLIYTFSRTPIPSDGSAPHRGARV